MLPTWADISWPISSGLRFSPSVAYSTWNITKIHDNGLKLLKCKSFCFWIYIHIYDKVFYTDSDKNNAYNYRFVLIYLLSLYRFSPGISLNIFRICQRHFTCRSLYIHLTEISLEFSKIFYRYFIYLSLYSISPEISLEYLLNLPGTHLPVSLASHGIATCNNKTQW